MISQPYLRGRGVFTGRVSLYVLIISGLSYIQRRMWYLEAERIVDVIRYKKVHLGGYRYVFQQIFSKSLWQNRRYA